ncbi:MAG: endo-1,4-beta-xylanase [Oscillospiraceae bacterium]|nr:endo-1,4-beta-xylanase [Oscillospiraceae bacterium]
MKKLKNLRTVAGIMTASILLTGLPVIPVNAESVPLINDTFENGFGTWKARTSGSTTLSLSDTYAHSGEKSLYVKDRTISWNGAGASMIGTMYAGKQYDFSVAVFYDDEQIGGQSQQFNLQCLYTDAEGKERYSFIGQTNAQVNQWSEIHASYTVPSDATNIVVYVEASTLSDFYMDDFTVSGEKVEDSNKTDGFLDDFDDGTVMGWQVRGSQTTLELTDKYAHSGKYSIYTDNREQLWNGATCNKTLVLEAGGYYQFGCWVLYDGETYTDTQKFSINLQYDLDGKENYYTVYTETANKGEWTYVGTECTIPEGAANIYVYVQTAYKPDASVTSQDLMGFYLDDVSGTRLPDPSIQEDISSLQDVYQDYFKIGCAVAGSEFTQGATKDLILKHYNSVTIGNELKPEAVLDQTATLAYMQEHGGDQTNPQISLKQAADMLKFCEENHLDVRGHVLVWHSQTPDWFFKENYDASADFVSPEIMDQRMENYIKNIMDAIKTQYPDLNVYAWDVVNEAASDSGTMRNPGAYSQGDGSSGLVSVYGDQSYIKKAFTYARKYAPENCKLFYNDYNEYSENKLNYIQSDILQELVDNKLIDGMGMQSHIGMSSPSIAQYESALRSYAAMGLEIQITELDIALRSNSDEDLLALAERYRECFDMFKRVKNDGVNLSAVVLWGITDSTSWIGGYPLLFDKNYQAKAAYYAVIDTDAPVQTIKNARAYICDENHTLQFALDAQAENEIGKAGSFKAVWDAEKQALILHVNAKQAGKLDIFSDYLNQPGEPEEYAVKAGENEITVSFAHVDSKVFAAGDTLRFDIVLNGTAWNSLEELTESSYGKIMIADIPAYAEATQGTPEIDGKIDAIWESANFININQFSLGEGATGTAKLLWDRDYIYILAEVTDPVLSKASVNVYEQDTVEIFLDENNHKTSAYESDDIQVRTNYDNEKSVTDGLSTDAFVSATSKTDTGYLVEFAIPSTLGGFRANQVVGFDAQINDDGTGDGKRTAISNWYDMTGMGYTDMSGLGILKLVGEESTLPGDANTDGIVDISDVVLMNRVYVGVDSVSEQGHINGDVDQSGKIDLADSMQVLRYLVHLIDHFETEA